MRVIQASILQTPQRGQLEHLENVVIVLDEDGFITSIESADSDTGFEQLSRARSDGSLTTLPNGSYLLPGMIDLHVHAPQWPQLGTGVDLPLEEWLLKNTFPLEARFENADFAQRVWDDMVPTLLSHGTTTAVYYSSIHVEATERLAATCISHGQRALVGRVGMDHPSGTPESYRDPSASAAIERSAQSISGICSLASELVEPIITPRFIPACTDDLLRGFGELAADTGTIVQTHCSESDWEHSNVLYRLGMSDTHALASFGLLKDNTVLAHCGMVDRSDMDEIRNSGAGIAHCPLSNAYFGNAVFPLRRAMDAHVNVGLGTDIAGGSHPGLLHQAAFSVTASRMLEDGVDALTPSVDRGISHSRIDITEAFWLATVGAANVLAKPLGLLTVGRPFDAFAINTDQLGTWDEVDDISRIFEKIVRLGSDSDITAVWVSGREVLTPHRSSDSPLNLSSGSTERSGATS